MAVVKAAWNTMMEDEGKEGRRGGGEGMTMEEASSYTMMAHRPVIGINVCAVFCLTAGLLTTIYTGDGIFEGCVKAGVFAGVVGAGLLFW